MNEKTQTKSGKDKEKIGIFSTIDKQKTSFFEKEDNSWWWTYALFLIVICLCAVWALATFFKS